MGRLATRFLAPHPGRPVPTPDPEVTFGASPMECEAAKAADGRHPWAVRWCLCASEPIRKQTTARDLSSRIASPGFDASHTSGSIWMGLPKYFYRPIRKRLFEMRFSKK